MQQQPKTADGKVVIDVWLAEHPFPNHYGRHFLEPICEVAADFERAHPDYHVNIQGHDFREVPRDVARAIEDGAATPHLAEYYATAAQLAQDTYTRDGRPYFTTIGKALDGRAEILGEPVVVDDIEPLARDFFTYNEELTSIPATVTTTLLYSNKTMLDAAGIAEPPRTWAELEDAAAAVAAAPGGPAHGAISWPTHGWLFQQALAQQDALLADHTNGRTGRAESVDLASKEMLAWADWWRRLGANGQYHYTDDWLTAIQAFARQEVAFTLSSSKLAHEFVRTGKDAGFDVVASRMPHNDAVPFAGNLVSGQSLWLADGLDPATRDGALAFTQFLISPRNAAAWHRAIGFLPVTRTASGLLDDEGWFDDNPHQRAAGDQLRASARTPATAGALLGDFAGIQRAMTRAMDDVLLRGADTGRRFARATDEAQRLLDEHNACCLRPLPRTPDRLDVF